MSFFERFRERRKVRHTCFVKLRAVIDTGWWSGLATREMKLKKDSIRTGVRYVAHLHTAMEMDPLCPACRVPQDIHVENECEIGTLTRALRGVANEVSTQPVQGCQVDEVGTTGAKSRQTQKFRDEAHDMYRSADVRSGLISGREIHLSGWEDD